MAPVGRTRFWCRFVVVAATIWLASVVAFGSRQKKQAQEQINEVVANLASGQVTLIAAHDGVIIATVGNQFEPGDLPPLIVPLADTEVVVLLGAVEWIQPPSNHTLLRLDAELHGLGHGASENQPRLNADTNLSPPEQVGLSALDPLRTAAQNLHNQLDLPEDLPLAELVLVHQSANQSSPVIWDLQYSVKQTLLVQNFWDTEVQRPSNTLLYPDKENHTGSVEIRYPPDDHSPGLLDWLNRPTGRLAQDVETDPQMAKAQQRVANDDGQKVRLAELVPLVKTVIEAMTPASSGRELAVIDSGHGFSWIIQPSAATRPQQKAETSRPSGAPTLMPTPHP